MWMYLNGMIDSLSLQNRINSKRPTEKTSVGLFWGKYIIKFTTYDSAATVYANWLDEYKKF